MDTKLKEKVFGLLKLGYEGDYWDFKRCWYGKDKKEDLLFDIINLANNLTDEDGLIIIGVEDKTLNVVGIENDQNRKNTQNLVDFMRDKKFLGDYRPNVRVATITIANHEIDVIVIKNTIDVPYILKEHFNQIRANNVYIRVQDSNTPKDKSASYDLQEKLWRKHFGIDKTARERLEILLKNKEDWVNESNSTVYYNKYYPEFRIIEEDDENNNGFDLLFLGQINLSSDWTTIRIYYHQTELVYLKGLILDSGRLATIIPDISFTDFPMKYSKRSYRYFIKDSLKHYLLELYREEPSLYSEESVALRNYLKWILQFNSEEEKNEFDTYLNQRFNEEDLLKINVDVQIPEMKNYEIKSFEDDCRQALYFQHLFQEFKEEKGICEEGFIKFNSPYLSDERW